MIKNPQLFYEWLYSYEINFHPTWKKWIVINELFLSLMDDNIMCGNNETISSQLFSSIGHPWQKT
jgi:hypothetical protein